ncbi:hypothetical protein [Mesobacillus harenae]|uniref:hypothetical protein n=1 Tax=Mesobacillus harenae TaxID=2213203 RepID=UPI001580FE89|nr:hypothetical protein [Mesobacillus harenae]
MGIGFIVLFILIVLAILGMVLIFSDEPGGAVILIVQKVGLFGFIGIFAWFILSMFGGLIDSITEDDSGYYDDTPSEWGPGADSNSSPGYHEVDGYYRSDGTMWSHT